jgi:flagellar basal body rod protein FlgG
MDAFSVSAAGALAQSARIDSLARNLASATIPGFRRDWLGFRALSDGSFAADRGMDLEAGTLETTGRALDFAIAGPGYFAVQDLESGDALYTRAGNFRLDSSGRLVTADGRCQVLSADGRGIALDAAAAGGLRLGSDGTLFTGDVEYGQLGVVEFEDVARLARRGDNLVENRGGSVGAVPSGRIQQGTLERSSVNPALEMAEMTRALRALEANLQAIRIRDAALERTVNDFARPAK